MALRFRVAALALLACLSASAISAAQTQRSVGAVAFETSGAPAAQGPFLRGLALLHNFEYERAAAAFREAQAADPGFAMAFWGEAMTHNHAVWQEQDRDAARAVLARLGSDPAARRAKAPTAREQAYLDAVETLYGEGDKKDRDFAYSEKMAALHRTWPEDMDGRAFHALSILGLAHEGRDFALYMRAAAMLEEVFPDNPDHPGVLHYLIHSYDDPVHAPLGLRAARLYGEVAPDAGHALHMTSHIFVAMGMWDDVAAMNERAVGVISAQRTAAGEPARSCGHYNEWLVYAYLQRGEINRADAIVAACGSDAARELAAAPVEGPLETYWSSVWSHTDIALARLVETGTWTDGAAPGRPAGSYLWSRFMVAYGEVLAARGDAARLREARAALQAAAAAIGAAGGRDLDQPLIPPARLDVMLGQAEGLARLADGGTDAGIALLRTAAEREATLPLAFGPPAIPKPSFELLAEELVALGRTEEARAAYGKALAATPGRRLVKEGLARIPG